jgi:acetophenone carboxylase
MQHKVRITEYLDIDLEKEVWCCNRCGRELTSARNNYKTGCLCYERNVQTVYEPVTEDGAFAPDPNLGALVEFYCPSCGTMVQNEYLLLGHPITHDIELDIDKLKEKHLGSKAK